MKYEWDEAKNRKNLAKHGLSFEDAAQVRRDLRRLGFPLAEGGDALRD